MRRIVSKWVWGKRRWMRRERQRLTTMTALTVSAGYCVTDGTLRTMTGAEPAFFSDGYEASFSRSVTSEKTMQC